MIRTVAFFVHRSALSGCMWQLWLGKFRIVNENLDISIPHCRAFGILLYSLLVSRDAKSKMH